MSKISILPADNFIVINKTILSDYERKIILMLYQPIIGSIASNLYFTLWTYLDHQEIISCEWSHHHLMSNMGLKLESIVESREKLEAIGLLKTYYKSGEINSYVYELYSPLSPNEVFNNPILNTALYSTLGKIEYKKIVAYFEMPSLDLNNYEDITVTFSSKFSPDKDEMIDNNLIDIRKHSKRNLELVSNLDLNAIFSLIPDEMFNHNSITKDLKELIYKLSFIYVLDDNTMMEIIKNSITDKKTIDKDLLQRNCRNYFKFENDGKLPSLAFKSQPEYLRKNVDEVSNKSKMIYTFETTPPIEFLSTKNNGVITNSDRDILTYLLIDLDLKPGVVNVLIDYVLRINDNKLIKNFVEAIALQWKRSNIETVDDAMNMAKKHTVSNNKNKNNKKHIENKPKWFDENVSKKEATTEEKALMESLLSDYK